MKCRSGVGSIHSRSGARVCMAQRFSGPRVREGDGTNPGAQPTPVILANAGNHSTEGGEFPRKAVCNRASCA
ncbi:hypothetical protein TUM20249_11860 [Pseudomonas tohonis]|nr:hypothetical protein TUM20249_11860 [Pseudomonas tohonis]